MSRLIFKFTLFIACVLGSLAPFAVMLHVFDDAFYAAAVFVVALTALAGPVLLKLAVEPRNKEQ